jgi:hypothetical protein
MPDERDGGMQKSSFRKGGVYSVTYIQSVAIPFRERLRIMPSVGKSNGSRVNEEKRSR